MGLFSGITDAIFGNNDAVQAQINAANSANSTMSSMFNTVNKNSQPWIDAGKSALNSIQANMGNFTAPFTAQAFQQDPGYQFDLQQGQAAIQRAAAAKGGLIGTGVMQQLSDYSQNMASNEFNNAYNRYTNNQNNAFNKYATLAGLGSQTNNSMAGLGMNTANQIGQNTIGAGNAYAANSMNAQNQFMSMGGMGLGAYAALA